MMHNNQTNRIRYAPNPHNSPRLILTRSIMRHFLRHPALLGWLIPTSTDWKIVGKKEKTSRINKKCENERTRQKRGNVGVAYGGLEDGERLSSRECGGLFCCYFCFRLHSSALEWPPRRIHGGMRGRGEVTRGQDKVQVMRRCHGRVSGCAVARYSFRPFFVIEKANFHPRMHTSCGLHYISVNTCTPTDTQTSSVVVCVRVCTYVLPFLYLEVPDPRCGRFEIFEQQGNFLQEKNARSCLIPEMFFHMYARMFCTCALAPKSRHKILICVKYTHI